MIKFLKYILNYKENLIKINRPPTLPPILPNLEDERMMFNTIKYNIEIFREYYECPPDYLKNRFLNEAKHRILLRIREYIEVECQKGICTLLLPIGIRKHK